MSFWSGIRSLFGGSATRIQTGDQYGVPGYYDTPTPKRVNEDTALQLSAFWACAKLLCENVATLPIHVYKYTDGERELQVNTPMWIVLNRRPNNRMTAVEFKETMMLNLVIHGNAYARIERNGRGDVSALWPLPAQQVLPELLDDGSVVYTYTMGSKVAVLAADNVLHIKIWGNGLVGLSPLAHARNTLGLGLAAEDYSSRGYINGGRPGGVLTMDGILTDPQRALIKKRIIHTMEGTENSHKTLLLEAGMDYKQVQMSPADMEMMETRRFQVEDIARFMGVPSVLINSPNTTAWGSGIEQIMLGFYNLNLRPYLDRWEQAIERILVKRQDRNSTDVMFDFEKILRGDMKSRADYFSKLVQNALMSVNEGRLQLGLPPVPDGNQLMVQANMLPLDELGEEDETNEVAEN